MEKRIKYANSLDWSEPLPKHIPINYLPIVKRDTPTPIINTPTFMEKTPETSFIEILETQEEIKPSEETSFPTPEPTKQPKNPFLKIIDDNKTTITERTILSHCGEYFDENGVIQSQLDIALDTDSSQSKVYDVFKKFGIYETLKELKAKENPQPEPSQTNQNSENQA